MGFWTLMKYDMGFSEERVSILQDYAIISVRQNFIFSLIHKKDSGNVHVQNLKNRKVNPFPILILLS